MYLIGWYTCIWLAVIHGSDWCCILYSSSRVVWCWRWILPDQSSSAGLHQTASNSLEKWVILQTPIIDNYCVTAPRDVLINTAQLVMLVKDQLAHRLLTNIHRGGWVDEWVSECVSVWVSECVSECVSEWGSVWMSEWVCEWVCECVSECVSEWVSVWVCEWLHE